MLKQRCLIIEIIVYFVSDKFSSITKIFVLLQRFLSKSIQKSPDFSELLHDA